MNLGNLFVFFVFVWLVVFFITLPIGIKEEDNVQKGHDSGAPKNPKIGRKILISVIISVFITLSFYYLMENSYLDFIQVRPE